MSAIDTTDDLLRQAITRLFVRKAQEVSTIDLRGRSALCDWFVVATCQSEVQLQAVLSGVRRDLRKAGHAALRAEAAPGSRWAVLDYGNLIMHLFLREARDFYGLDRLWKDAPQETAKPEDYPAGEETEEEEVLEEDPNQERWS